MIPQAGSDDGALATWTECIASDLKKGGLQAFQHLAGLLKLVE